jgi:hypothetical protein
MLPIVKRKTLAIPHGLAALSAAVCLGLAFVTDFQEREQDLRAQANPPAPIETIVNSADENTRGERASANDPQRKLNTDRPKGRGTPNLLPWFPGQRTGH